MFRTRFKNEIAAEFLPPVRSGVQKVIILCDGMPSIPRKQMLAEFLSKKGYWFVYPRYRGAWESDGTFLAKSPHLDILDVICPVVDWSILKQAEKVETSNKNYAAYIREAFGRAYRLSDRNWKKLYTGK